MVISEVSNLRAGRVVRWAVFVVPSVVATLSLAGVVVRPDLGMQTAEQELAQAEQRVGERQVHHDRLESSRTCDSLERAEAVLALVRQKLPAPLPELELHGMLRLIFELGGAAVSSLEMMEPYDPGLEHLDDVALLREVRMHGASSLTALFGALNTFQSFGRPLSVLEFRVKPAEEPGLYEWSVGLALFESFAVPAAETQADTGPEATSQ